MLIQPGCIQNRTVKTFIKKNKKTLFQISAVLYPLNFLLIKKTGLKNIMVPQIQNSTTAFNMDNNKTMLIRIISEGYIKIEWVIFIFLLLSHSITVYTVFWSNKCSISEHKKLL